MTRSGILGAKTIRYKDIAVIIGTFRFAFTGSILL